MKLIVFIFIFFIALFGTILPISALETTLSGLLKQARTALDQENYQSAVATYLAARRQFPTDPTPAVELGNLYEAQKLYSLALSQYTDAARLAPSNPQIRQSQAESLAYLDRNTQAVEVLEQALKDFPNNLGIGQALGWLYFKTEQNTLGIALIKKLVKVAPHDRNLEMTLGTLYSGIYDYQQSKLAYLHALALAPSESTMDRHFRSICWYNLSLLEKSFTHGTLAFDDLQKSLDAEDRSTTWLALGELFQSRLAVPKAFDAFQKSAKSDETPLSLYDIASLENLEGHPDQALAAAQGVLAFRDDSWIYDFGVTKAQFERDMALLFSDIWRSKARSLEVLPRLSWWDWISWFQKKLTWSLQAWYWNQRYKVLQLDLANAATKAGNAPESWSDLVLANRNHPEVALKYLKQLKSYEVPRNPSALPLYLAEEGRLRQDTHLLEQAVATFLTPDQQAEKIEAEAVLVKILRKQGQGQASYPFVNDIYKYQPGALYTQGLSLPVVDVIWGGSLTEQKAWRHAVSDFADSLGWDAKPYDRPSVVYTLAIELNSSTGHWYLLNNEGASVLQGTFQIKGKKEAVLAGIFTSLYRRVP